MAQQVELVVMVALASVQLSQAHEFSTLVAVVVVVRLSLVLVALVEAMAA
jgi:hypothetical protein